MNVGYLSEFGWLPSPSRSYPKYWSTDYELYFVVYQLLYLLVRVFYLKKPVEVFVSIFLFGLVVSTIMTNRICILVA